MRLKKKLTVLFLMLAVTPIVIVGALAYQTGRRIIEKTSINHLVSTNILKTSELHRWIGDSKTSIEELAQRPLVQQFSAVIHTHDASAPDFIQTKESLIADHLRPRLKYGNFTELFVICPIHGIILASSDPRQDSKYRDTQPYYLEGKNLTHVQGVYYSPSLEQAAMTIGTPITDKQGNLIAVLAGRLNLDELSRIMSLKSGKNRTEDTYLVNRFNFFVTEPRFGQNYALRKAVRTQGVEAGLSGKTGVDFYIDYRGEAVIGAYKWLPEYRMCILTEYDRSEAYAPIIQFGWTVTGIAGVTALAISLFAVFFSKTLIRPIQKLAEDAEEIGRGNLDHVVGTTAPDEIGDLSRAFDRMTRNLKTTTVSRDEVLEERNFSDSIINSLPGIFYLFDATGHFIRWNQNFEKVTEYAPDVIRKMRPLDLFSDEDKNRVAEKIQNAFTIGEDVVDADLISRSGKRIPYYFTGLNVSIGGKKLLIGTGMDITERKLAEERLNQAREELQRSNQELEQFAYVASHDLQEPLRMVSSYTQLLARRYSDKLDQDARDFIHYAVDGANRMQQLIQDLLSFSRVTTKGQPCTQTQSREALMEALSNLKATITETGARITHDHLPEVYADRTQLTQVFQNLIGNAIKFRNPDNIPRIHISSKQQDTMWIFSVQDNGIGMDPKYFDRIFTIFQRLHTRQAYPGTGIGLALCKRIIERHGGCIRVESEPEKGTVFRFTLPISDSLKGRKP
ncbi:MAG: ATP-binding protein [Desulfatirhabdiaceae bacterium]